MSEAKHTPLPWRVFRSPTGLVIGIGDSEGGGIIDPRGGFWLDDPERGENADFVVRAVNNHDALVKALEALTKLYVDMVNSGDCGFWDPEKVEEIKAARSALLASKAKP